MKRVCSWAVVEIATGRCIGEIWHRSQADAINAMTPRTHKAIPIAEWLASLSAQK